jgi:hypothetical protein
VQLLQMPHLRSRAHATIIWMLVIVPANLLQIKKNMSATNTDESGVKKKVIQNK